MILPGGKPYRTVIVADDLTGACDAAVAFATAGFATYIGLHCDEAPPAGWQAYAINTDTRCSGAAEAAERAGKACARAQELRPERIVKKIDSLMRGNVAAEIASARAVLQPRITLLAPAFPALGRIVRAGRIEVGEESEPIDIAGRLPGARCAAIPAAALAEAASWCARAISDGIEILIPDAEDESQMQRLARAAAGIDGLLWVGSGGLTKAIAATLGRPEAPVGDAWQLGPATLPIVKPLLVCAGSDHGVTLAQLEDLRLREDTVFVQADLAGYSAANAALRRGRNAVLLIARTRLNAEAMREFAEQLRIELCGGLLLTGGDTALRILEALRADGIRLAEEILPGIPRGEILGGAAAGVPVVTKSGAFGQRDALSRCVEMLRTSRATAGDSGQQPGKR